MARPATVWVMDQMDQGLLDPRNVAERLMDYMTEADVCDFAETEFEYDPEAGEEEE